MAYQDLVQLYLEIEIGDKNHQFDIFSTVSIQTEEIYNG